MADQKLSDLTALTTPSGDDLLYVVDDPAGTPADRKLALDNLFTRGTVTTSAPVIDASQTWNDGGVTFTGMKLNVTDTASASGSLLMDLQVDGSSVFNVTKSGSINMAANSRIDFGTVEILTAANILEISYAGSAKYRLAAGRFSIESTYDLGWVPSNNLAAAQDLIIGRRAAANLRLGAADAASPVAQTLSVQSVAAGNSNVAGANFTITGSQGTGTGAGGSIIFQVAPAGSSGTAQNALVTALTINSFGQLLAIDGDNARPAFSFANDGDTGLYLTGANLVYTYGGTARSGFTIRNGIVGVTVADAGAFVFSSTSSPTAAGDVFLFRDAANTLALRNEANAQAFRVYNTYTASDNFERANIFWDSNVLKIGTEKGSAGGTDRAVYLASNSNIYLENGGFLRWGMVGTDPNFIALRNTGGLKFSSSTSFPGTPDVGIARSGTNTLKITNGSTGTGALESASLKTDAPTGGTAATWKLGTVASVSPTLPNRTIEVEIGGTTYYISAKTTND